MTLPDPFTPRKPVPIDESRRDQRPAPRGMQVSPRILIAAVIFWYLWAAFVHYSEFFTHR